MYDFDAKLLRDTNKHLKEVEKNENDYYTHLEETKEKIEKLVDDFDILEHLYDLGLITDEEKTIFGGNCYINTKVMEF